MFVCLDMNDLQQEWRGENTRERRKGGGSCSCKRVDAGKACAIRASAETSGRGLNRIGSD